MVAQRRGTSGEKTRQNGTRGGALNPSIAENRYMSHLTILVVVTTYVEEQGVSYKIQTDVTMPSCQSIKKPRKPCH
jgi:hypothetical protein